MTDSVMLALGKHKFILTKNGYDTLRSSAAFHWQEHPIFGAPAKLQYTGRPTEIVTLTGTLLASKTSEGLASLRLDAARGESLLLVDGRGTVLGHFVICDIEEEARVFLPDGSARKVEFTVRLKKVHS